MKACLGGRLLVVNTSKTNSKNKRMLLFQMSMLIQRDRKIKHSEIATMSYIF